VLSGQTLDRRAVQVFSATSAFGSEMPAHELHAKPPVARRTRVVRTATRVPPRERHVQQVGRGPRTTLGRERYLTPMGSLKGEQRAAESRAACATEDVVEHPSASTIAGGTPSPPTAGPPGGLDPFDALPPCPPSQPQAAAVVVQEAAGWPEASPIRRSLRVTFPRRLQLTRTTWRKGEKVSASCKLHDEPVSRAK